MPHPLDKPDFGTEVGEMRIDIDAYQARNARRHSSLIRTSGDFLEGNYEERHRAAIDIDNLIAEVARMYAIWECIDCFSERLHSHAAALPCLEHGPKPEVRCTCGPTREQALEALRMVNLRLVSALDIIKTMEFK